jgi:hypothetical protein
MAWALIGHGAESERFRSIPAMGSRGREGTFGSRLVRSHIKLSLYAQGRHALRLFRRLSGPLGGRFIDAIRCNRGQQLIGLFFPPRASR